MKQVITNYLSAIIDFSFYQNSLPLLSFKNTFLSYLGFAVVVSALLAARYSLYLLPQVREAWPAAVEQVVQSLPQDRTLRWTGTELESTPEYFSVPYPAAFRINATEFQLPQSLLIVDTRDDQTVPESETAVVKLTPSMISLWQGSGSNQEQQLSELLEQEEYSITTTDVQNGAPQATTAGLNLLDTVQVILPPLFILYFCMQRTFHAFFTAALFALFNSAMGRKRPFMNTVQLTFWIFIPAEIIYQVTRLGFGLHFEAIFSLTVVTYYAMIVWNTPQEVQST